MENSELLQAIDQMISENNRKMAENVSSLMDEKLKPISSKLDNLEQGINEVKVRTTKIEIALEYDISKKLGALFDGHDLDKEKLSNLDSIERTVKDTRDTVGAMFKVIQEHSGDINELKLAK